MALVALRIDSPSRSALDPSSCAPSDPRKKNFHCPSVGFLVKGMEPASGSGWRETFWSAPKLGMSIPWPGNLRIVYPLKDVLKRCKNSYSLKRDNTHILPRSPQSTKPLRELLAFSLLAFLSNSEKHNFSLLPFLFLFLFAIGQKSVRFPDSHTFSKAPPLSHELPADLHCWIWKLSQTLTPKASSLLPLHAFS